jgi:hypothetical protein
MSRTKEVRIDGWQCPEELDLVGPAPLERLKFEVDREGEAPSEPGFPRLGRSLALPEIGLS